MKRIFLLWLLIGGLSRPLLAQTFIHPGGLHTLADLDRMKTNVLAGNHPWIDDWKLLVTDPQAKSNYVDHAQVNMGSSRQNADLDAHAAYLNLIEWRVTGDANFADTAVRICNDWARDVNQVPHGTDVPGLMGIAIAHFAEAGELLRIYPGWSRADFQNYTNIMVRYLYPSCNSFLTKHNGACINYYWANWDTANIEALIAMGVLCDNTNIYDQGVNYFKTGEGNGSISNAVPFLYDGGSLGQWQESGRDQEHAQLGIGELGNACQVAWNQGLDLFGFANNRLLAGAEYVARYNLWHEVPFTPYTDCTGDNLFFASANGRGRIDDRPVYEMLYNHYAVLKGLNAPNVKAMAQLYRPERGSPDHFGYDALTYTLKASTSVYPSALPAVPAGLTAQPGLSQVNLSWVPGTEDLAQGYKVLRSTTKGGPYTSIAAGYRGTWPKYTDTRVVDGTTYYYVVAAFNQNGTSAESSEASATPVAPGPLPSGWSSLDIGAVTAAGEVVYADADQGTFMISSTGARGFQYIYVNATNDFTIFARLKAGHGDNFGLMLRASLAADAPFVQFGIAAHGRESTYGVRLTQGGDLKHYTSGDRFTYLPSWYKFIRSGNTFTACQSDDGVSWFIVQSSTLAMGNTCCAGIFISNGNAVFDNMFYTNAAVSGNILPSPGLR